ncbi:HNH endonuclease [Pantoea sp. AG1095]|uniref:HNH endonuclease n=1 Tax=Pantoea sp. AG1095 TaxID=2184004 RepID=UPI000D8ACA36|nr:HNH endonuclease [Pantoea sp. AG1095]PYG52223.1 HNH endonuclease [Pantoea sp. AG1095]
MTKLLIPHVGELLTFKEIDDKYRQDIKDQTGLQNSGFLRPNGRHKLPRAIFAEASLNGDIDELLFVGDGKGNYRTNFVNLLTNKKSIWVFRRTNSHQNKWRVAGEARVEALLKPNDGELKKLLKKTGHKLIEQDQGWQLINAQGEPQFSAARDFTYAVKLIYTQQVEMPEDGDSEDIGRRIEREVLVRMDQQKLRNTLLNYYPGCVVTGLPHNKQAASWLEAAHIVDDKNNDKHFRHNGLDNGLLLRSDLHRLFDAKILTINPDNGTVELLTHDAALLKTYKKINGRICKNWGEIKCYAKISFLKRHYLACHDKFKNLS